MKPRLKLWMLSALVAGFASGFAGVAAAKSSNQHLWPGGALGSMIGLLVSSPVLVLPRVWNHRARRRGSETGPREPAMSGIVVLATVLIMAAILYVLHDCGRLE